MYFRHFQEITFPEFLCGLPLASGRELFHQAEQFWRGIPAARAAQPLAQQIWRAPQQILPEVADQQPPYWHNPQPLPVSHSSSSSGSSSAPASSAASPLSIFNTDVSEVDDVEIADEEILDSDDADEFLEVDDDDVGPVLEDVGVQANFDDDAGDDVFANLVKLMTLMAVLLVLSVLARISRMNR